MEPFIALLGVIVGGLGTLGTQWLLHKRSFQLIAVERRLDAHQKAFATWWNLATRYHNSEDRNRHLIECQEFWKNNCLFLGRKSRKAFRETLYDLMFYDSIREQGGQKMIELSRSIENVFQALMEDAAIPNVNQDLIDIRKLLGRAAETSTSAGPHQS